MICGRELPGASPGTGQLSPRRSTGRIVTGMYLPRHFRVDPAAVDRMLSDLVTVELVTFDGIQPVASLIPVAWQPPAAQDPSEVAGRLLGHLARANPQWSSAVAGSRALAIATGPQGYVSPSWYPSTAEHGRTVPTWNYVSLHLTGPLVVHQEPDWVRDVVERLTRRHEEHRPRPWRLQDAPQRYVDSSVRAIVGIELVVTSVQAKAKLSQNRDPGDVAGVIDGMLAEATPDARRIAALMQGPLMGTGDS